MDSSAGTRLYPLHRCKTLHLVRHVQGIHNIAREMDHSAYMSYDIFDTRLTPLGCDDDILWTPDVREKHEEVKIRGKKFLNWLWTRKEKEVAIVSHRGFLYHTLSSFGNDKSMTGSDKSETNYPGKVPSGLDLPSDIAKEKQPEMVKDD